MNINPATSRRRTQLPPEAFVSAAGLYGQLPIPRLARIAALLCALILAWNAQGWCAGPLPLNLDRPDYNYSGVTCMSCHFTAAEGNPLHTARAAGVTYNTTTGMWERTGHGWWDSRHAQSQNGWSNPTSTLGWTQPTGTYGENDNTFCANCHSPLQASVYAIASISESGTTATVTLSAPGIPLADIAVGDIIFIAGNTVAGYNNVETTAPAPAIGGWTVTGITDDPTDTLAASITFTGLSPGGLATGTGGKTREYRNPRGCQGRIRAADERSRYTTRYQSNTGISRNDRCAEAAARMARAAPHAWKADSTCSERTCSSAHNWDRVLHLAAEHHARPGKSQSRTAHTAPPAGGCAGRSRSIEIRMKPEE